MNSIKFNTKPVVTNPQGDAGWPIVLLSKLERAKKQLGERHLCAVPVKKRAS